MFSRHTKGLDGLEKFETQDMLSAVDEMPKANKDISIKKSRKQSEAREQKKRNKAVRESSLSFCNDCNHRPHREPRTPAPVERSNAVQVSQDSQASCAIRNTARPSDAPLEPGAMRDETWPALPAAGNSRVHLPHDYRN